MRQAAPNARIDDPHGIALVVPVSASDDPLLIHPEEEDEEDVEPESSTSETRSEEEDTADGAAFDDVSVPPDSEELD